MVHHIRLLQDVYSAVTEGTDSEPCRSYLTDKSHDEDPNSRTLLHRRGDDAIASEQWLAELYANNVQFELVSSITMEEMVEAAQNAKIRMERLREAGMYGCVQDACDNPQVDKAVQEALQSGSTQVWYRKEGVGMFTLPDPDPNNLQATHTHLTSIACRDPEACFFALQGEMWSPNGEANGLVSERHSHTSMSVGDCLVIGKAVHVCAGTGWKVLEG